MGAGHQKEQAMIISLGLLGPAPPPLLQWKAKALQTTAKLPHIVSTAYSGCATGSPAESAKATRCPVASTGEENTGEETERQKRKKMRK